MIWATMAKELHHQTMNHLDKYGFVCYNMQPLNLKNGKTCSV